jgi:predicted PurR-regulated permease PerM
VSHASLEAIGRKAWALVGIAAAVVIAYAGLAALSGLVIPLVVAVVLGALLVPVVDVLARRMPRALAAGVVLLGLSAVVLGSVSVAVVGVADRAASIRDQVTAGLSSLREWLVDLGVTLPRGEDVTDRLSGLLGGSSSGLSQYVSSAFSSASAFLIGLFVAVFILYYVLRDWEVLTRWVGAHIGVPAALGDGMIRDATWSVRRYFVVLTVTSLVTAVIIGVAAGVLGLPLAFTIALVTFVTSYVPFLGAIVSGAFAVLVALGSGGVGPALVILTVVLVTQNLVQPLLNNRMTASELSLHPVVAFGSTIVGAVLAGVLGAALSAPVLAMIIRIRGRVVDYLRQTARNPQSEDPAAHTTDA